MAQLERARPLPHAVIIFSPNMGKLLENQAFPVLRRWTSNVHYYTSPASYEVDFYSPQGS